MTKEEKIRLSNSINNLEPEHLGRVVEIIQERMPKLNEVDSDEIEIDLESLDDETLRELQQYISTVKKRASKKRSLRPMMGYRPMLPPEENTENRIL